MTDIEIIQTENWRAFQHLLERPGFANSVSLIYCDPPFATGKTQEADAGSYRDPGDLAEWVNNVDRVSSYFRQMLHESGCVVFHCDWRTNYLARSCLNRTMGARNFASEIIWSYKRWPTKQRNFQRMHDTLLRYVAEQGKQTWNQLFQGLSESTIKHNGTKKQRTKWTNGKTVRDGQFDTDSPGACMSDVWHIPIIAPTAKERVGYPTQKPEALLERLILSCTNPGDLVLDPYMGSGTTLAVAKRLGRRAIGIDVNPEAIAVARRRLGLD